MPSFTIKQIPEELYSLLRRQAHANKRSVNKEIIECLIKALNPEQMDSEEILKRAQALRESIPEQISHGDIRRAMHEGRL